MQLCDSESIVKLKTVGTSYSTRDGGERANDKFRQHLRKILFGECLQDIFKDLGITKDEVEQRNFLEGYVRGFETAKYRYPKKTKETVEIAYEGHYQPKPGQNGKVAWTRSKIVVPR